MKLLSIVANCEACAVSMKPVLNEFAGKYEIEEKVVTQELVDQYGLTKTPALVLIDVDKVLGILYGYQPTFILEQWLIAKERGK